jgi:hypothetical protein
MNNQLAEELERGCCLPIIVHQALLLSPDLGEHKDPECNRQG